MGSRRATVSLSMLVREVEGEAHDGCIRRAKHRETYFVHNIVLT